MNVTGKQLIGFQTKAAGHRNFQGDTHISQMKRSHAELVEYLSREMSFPHGAYLMTGTCIVPDPPFTLQAHDEIHIQIEPIGTLIQTVHP